jgi:hypothetical protein
MRLGPAATTDTEAATRAATPSDGAGSRCTAASAKIQARLEERTILDDSRRSRREVADVATAAKRVELQIAELERRADEDGGQDNTSEQLAELRRQHADLQNSQERATAISRRLMTEINAFPSGKEATKSAYTAAEEVAKTVRHK